MLATHCMIMFMSMSYLPNSGAGRISVCNSKPVDPIRRAVGALHYLALACAMFDEHACLKSTACAAGSGTGPRHASYGLSRSTGRRLAAPKLMLNAGCRILTLKGPVCGAGSASGPYHASYGPLRFMARRLAAGGAHAQLCSTSTAAALHARYSCRGAPRRAARPRVLLQ